MDLKKIKIDRKIAFSFTAIALIIIILSFIFYADAIILSRSTNDLYRHPFAVHSAILRIDGDILRIRMSMKDLTNSKELNPRNNIELNINKFESNILKDFEIVRNRFLGDRRHVDEMIVFFKDWKPIRDKIIQLTLEGKPTEAAEISNEKEAKHLNELNQKINYFKRFSESKAYHFNDNAKIRANKGKIIIKLAMGLSLILVIIIAVLLSKSITRSIKQAGEMSD